MQQRVHEEVERTRRRSGWPAQQTLAALGIPRRTYYRWLKEEAWARALPEAPLRPVQPYEALPEEKQAVLDYARRHAELRHRELAWRMVDEDVACLSPSTVYRILKEANLVCPWRRRQKRRRSAAEFSHLRKPSASPENRESISNRCAVAALKEAFSPRTFCAPQVERRSHCRPFQFPRLPVSFHSPPCAASSASV